MHIHSGYVHTILEKARGSGACVGQCMYVYVCTCMHMYMHICTCICVYAYVYDTIACMFMYVSMCRY
jgi:hypothetical protein